MRLSTGIFYRLTLFATIILAFASPVRAQHLLTRQVTLSPASIPLQQALKEIAAQGGFYFSYNSDQIPGDSLIDVPATRTSVRELLSRLLGDDYQYSETGDYVIIRARDTNGKSFLFRGYVVNKNTGAKISDASVYETRQLVSTLTDANGYFQLKIRGPSPVAMLRVSKSNFNDTAYLLQAEAGREVTLGVSPIRSVVLDSVIVMPGSDLENSWLGKLFISSRQKVRDLNLSSFFVRQPFQYSLVPGIGTHGKMSAQVANKFSFNILGGYSGGVNGFELGGLFNIDRKNVRYAQVAGLFNTVGGSVEGAQVAGLYNGILDSVNGVQVAGLINRVGTSFHGVQIAGLTNRVTGDVSGIQIAGLYNHTPRLAGVQIAGIGNKTDQPTAGVQIAGIFNDAPEVKGLQIGLINLADTSSGYSLGLVNIIRHGLHQFSLSYNDALDLNIAYKGGNTKLYSILLAGASFGQGRKAYGFGYGLGHVFGPGRKLSFTAEITEQSIYVGKGGNFPLLTRIQPAVNWKLNSKIALFAGPAFSLYFREGGAPAHGYGDITPLHHLKIASHVSGWFGFQAGFTFF